MADRRQILHSIFLVLLSIFCFTPVGRSESSIRSGTIIGDDNDANYNETREKILPERKYSAGIERKIGGQLQIQIELKKSYKKSPQPETLNTMKKMGIKTEDMEKQLVYIHFKRKPTASQIESLKKVGVTLYEDSWIPPLKNHPTGYIIASMPVDRLYDVARKTFVKRLDTAERVLHPKNDRAASYSHVDAAWNYGYDGTGVRIAILDSGLDTSHPDIPAPVASKDFSNYPVLDDTIANQVSEHGTHVSGTAVGRGAQSNGTYKGMAYGADLVFLKIGDDSAGSASNAAMGAAIMAAVGSYSANIISSSYGGLDEYNDGSDEVCQAVDWAVDQGAVVFVSAGNEADGGTHYSGTVTANSITDFIQVDVGTTTQAYFVFQLNWYDGTSTTNPLNIYFTIAARHKQ